MAISVGNIVAAYITAQGLTSDPHKTEIETGITNLVQAIVDEFSNNGQIIVVSGTTAQPTPPLGGAVAVPPDTQIGTIS
jgi:hypothetical protein